MAELVYDLPYSTEVETAHPTWARPFAGGTLRAFFVPSVMHGREIVELVQRMDIEPTCVTYDRAWDLNKWGFGDFYDLRASVGDFRLILRNLENALVADEHYDVLVIPGINGWGHFTPRTRAAIVDRVRNGSGLVLVKPFAGAEVGPVTELEELSPLVELFQEGLGKDPSAGEGYPQIAFGVLKSEAWIPAPHYITRGIPFGLFPCDELAYYPYRARGEVIIRSESGDPVAAVGECGRGRVVAFGYYPRDILPQHREYTGSEATFDPIVDGWKGARFRSSDRFLEHCYTLVFRSMVWAARREPALEIAGVTPTSDGLAVATSGGREASLACRIRDDRNRELSGAQVQGREIRLPEPIRLGGSYRVDVLALEGDRVADWLTLPLEYPSELRLEGVELDAGVLERGVRPGEVLEARIEVRGSGELHCQIVDDFDQVLWLERRSVPPGTAIFRLPVEEVSSQHLRVRALALLEGHEVGHRESPSMLVLPATRTLDDFEVFMTPQNRGGGDLLPLVRRRHLDAGITGLYPGSPATVAMSGARGLGVYWYHRAPYTERKERYLRTRDTSHLRRVPCLNDPALWEGQRAAVAREVARARRFSPIAYFANDEGSLTCYVDELDLCFCEHCMERMREWLRGEYGSLEELNRSWDTRFGGWDQVVPETREQARARGRYAAWADHRSFMELTFARAYRNLAAMVGETDPEGVLRMSGCQATTAYSGYDYYELHRIIRYFEAYPSGGQYEFHRSFRDPRTILGGWFGYGAEGATARHQIWTAVLHELTLASIFWEYSFLNPDYTYSRSARDYGELFRELRREGIGKLLLYGGRRDDLGIGVHYSMASVHATNALGDAARFEANRKGWLRLLEDLGYQYRFISSQQIESGVLEEQGYRVLILPYSVAVSAQEVQRIATFADRGGTVLGDFRTAVMNEHCVWQQRGALDALFGIERLNFDAGPFYINDGFCPVEGFDLFPLPLSHIPGRDYSGTGLALVEMGTRAAGGAAAYVDDFMRRVAGVIVRAAGKGRGIYLNLALDRYEEVRRQAGGLTIRELLRSALTLAGVLPPVSLESPGGHRIDSGYEVVSYRDGDATYLALLRDAAGEEAVGKDGLVSASGRDGEPLTQEALTVRLSRPAYAYDARAGRFLGRCDRFEARLAPGDAGVYALLPHPVLSLELALPARVGRGERVEMEAHLEASDGPADHRNVFCISVFDPAGEYAWVFSRNVLARGSARNSFRMPFSAPQGRWRVVVKDVASGVKAEGFVEVE